MPSFAKIASVILATALVPLAGYMIIRQPAPVATSAATRQVLYYSCPMHPHYRSDHTGECPICGMRLEPAYSGDSTGEADSAPDIPGVVRISAARQQMVGVLAEEVKSARVSHALRVPGRVAIDDQRRYRIIASVDGWIRELGPNPAGTFVRKNQVLASYYAQNLTSTVQTYIFGLQANALAQSGDAQRGTMVLNMQAALDSLRALGMSQFQIEEIGKTRAVPSDIRVYSPTDGYVMSRNVSPEQRFDKGTELYSIADLGRVWVMTDMFEKDRELLTPGARATIRYQNREYRARMCDALPQFDAQSRTLKTRFELENPGFILRPDMFVDVELQVEMPAAVTVPADSVVDLGRRQTVYVETASGVFEPRIVETGWRLGDRVQVTGGLQAGERIVVSGNFLVDSESRMKLPAKK